MVPADEVVTGRSPACSVIFDVDGTLYWQKGLRIRMMRDLFLSAMVSSRTRLDFRILKRFREDREILAEKVQSGFAEAQYRVTSDALNVSPHRVKEAVERWIYERPLRYLRRFRVEGIEAWLDELRSAGVGLGVYSEYPAQEKLSAMGLRFDAVVSSTDVDVDAFKPSSKGLRVVLEKLGTLPEKALFIGDRVDRDQACAENAGVKFLLFGEQTGRSFSSYPPPEDLLPDFIKEALSR